MVEHEGYMYVGTGRNVVARGFQSLGLKPTKSFMPEHFSLQAEIWRYPVNGCPQHGQWELVYRVPEEYGACPFRSMIVYTNDKGETALYGGTYSTDGNEYILTSKDGLTWTSLSFPMPNGYYIRPMKVYGGKLYASVCQPLAVQQETYLYVTENPADGWRRVNTNQIVGEIFSMTDFNGYLYVGAMPPGGFAVWKSRDPESGEWECVVDKGAGDGLNEIPMDMTEFDGHLYVGSGVNGAIYSTDPDNRFVLPKGFDLIRIDRCDNWEVIVGREPIWPTKPTRGERNLGIYSSGFGNLFNPYCWTLRSYRGRLFVGTWDSAILYKFVIGDWIEQGDFEEELKNVFSMILAGTDMNKLAECNVGLWLKALTHSLKYYPHSYGFDMLTSDDGYHFCKMSIDGFRNNENYGIRNLVEGSDGNLYIGTANPTQGCEVWVGSEGCC